MKWVALLLMAVPVFGADRKPAMASANPTRDAIGCVSEKDGVHLVLKKTGESLNLLQDLETCERIVSNSHEGLYCRYHRDKATLGKNAKQFEGWFPTQIRTNKGIGQCPLPDLKVCLDVISNVTHGTVCTNTCTGWAVTHSESEGVCGASITLDWCLKASKGASKNWVCSYTGDGNGNLDNWVQTRMGARCSYEGTPQRLEDCRTAILKKQ